MEHRRKQTQDNNAGSILVSACLLGRKCRYDGSAKRDASVSCFCATLPPDRVIPVCPEELGGLPTPRPPAERVFINGTSRVLNRAGEDVSDAFDRGATETLRIAVESGARVAILKANSPSCGSGEIYDGSFTGKRIPGNGVTVERLTAHGILILNERNFTDYFTTGNIPPGNPHQHNPEA